MYHMHSENVRCFVTITPHFVLFYSLQGEIASATTVDYFRSSTECTMSIDFIRSPQTRTDKVSERIYLHLWIETCRNLVMIS